MLKMFLFTKESHGQSCESSCFAFTNGLHSFAERVRLRKRSPVDYSHIPQSLVADTEVVFMLYAGIKGLETVLGQTFES